MTDYTETAETIRYTADVIATTPDGRVLLIERGWDPFEGHWALPGGHVDPGETGLAAAARELAEETGVRVAPGDLSLIGVWDAPGRDPRGRYVTVAYHAVVPADTVAVAGDDARTARWWPLTALPARLAFDHADILRAVDRSTPVSSASRSTGYRSTGYRIDFMQDYRDLSAQPVRHEYLTARDDAAAFAHARHAAVEWAGELRYVDLWREGQEGRAETFVGTI